jgi:ATP-dependent Clp protease ATP-binding subunit ClpC
VSTFGYELTFAPDCLALFAKTRELEVQEGLRPCTVLQAYWELDLPGSRLLARCGLTRDVIEPLLTEEGNTPGGLGDLIYWACRAARDANAEYLCDSLDLAQQVVLRPWGRLEEFLRQHPVSASDLQQIVRELQSGTGRLEAELLQLGTPLSGRPARAQERPLRRLAQIMTRTRVRSAVITGPPGCGKSTLLAGLALQIETDAAPRSLRGAPVIRVDVDAVVAAWQRGGKDALRKSCQAARDADAILVLEDLRDWEDNARPIGDFLDLAAAELRCRVLTSADPALYRRMVDRDPSLLARFEELELEPLDLNGCLEVLRGLRPELEEHYGIPAADDAVERAPGLAKRYIHDRVSPAGAVYLLDEAFALAAMDGAAGVTLDHVCTVIEERTGIPVRELGENDAQILLNLEEELGRRVVGQRQAIISVAKTIRRSRAGLRDPNRPIGSFLFVGPSGVGKTELAKATAEVLFGSDQDLVSFDMSEYQEYTVWTLIGSSRGYKMAEQGGTLTEAVRRKPYSVLLFDEIEKAHPQVLDILLQVLEEGRLTDGIGRRIDFRNTLVIMTSNLASREVAKGSAGELGFRMLPADAGEDGQPITEDRLDATLRVTLRPEFINRIDEIVAFRPLTRPDLVAIAGLQLEVVAKRLESRRIGLEATPAALEWLAERGYDRAYGARPLRRLIQELVSDPAAELLLAGRLRDGHRLLVDVSDGELQIVPAEEPTGAAHEPPVVASVEGDGRFEPPSTDPPPAAEAPPYGEGPGNNPQG